MIGYFIPKIVGSLYEKNKIDSFITVCLSGILLILTDFAFQLIYPTNNFIITISSLVSLIIFLILNLFVLKKKGIEFAGNLLSLGMILIISFFMNLIGENINLMFKYLQSFYASLAFLALGLLFASRKVLMLNVLIVIASATHVYISAIAQSPELKELYLTGYINYTGATIGISLILYFAMMFADNAIKAAEEDAQMKEIKNQEYAAIEEEIRASNEQLLSTSDALMVINEELEISKEKAEESSRVKSAFLTNISHEIRTPMNGIIGFSRMLEDDNLPQETRSFYIDVIVKSSEQLLKIIDDTLEISRLAAKRANICEELINLNDLLNKLHSTFKRKAEDKNIEFLLEYGLSNQDCLILIDQEKLYKAIYNLVGNAIKFTNKGHILVSYQIEGAFIRFLVEDTGIGFDRKKSLNVFDSFVQADENIAMKYGGLGVGLSIAKENIELLGGILHVQSMPGQGTKFFIQLPYKKGMEIKPEPQTDLNEKQTPVYDKKNLILIAEDEEFNYLFFHEVLRKMKIDLEVCRAKNGMEAVEICKSNSKISLVFMDLKMPVMSGIEATAKIKEFAPDLTIIAQTAYTSEEDRRLAIEAGCSDFITKPINVQNLEQLISMYLNKNI